VYGDLRDLSSLISILKSIKPDRIYHLAAQSYVPYSYDAPVDTLTTNIIGTTNLLEAIRITGQRPFIHICSSSEVYGQPEPHEVPIKESNPIRPVSPYGVSKVGEERIAWVYYKAYGMKIVITRMFTHTGARRGDVFVASNFARQLAQIEKSGGQGIIKVGNLSSVRTFADVRDTVRAYALLRDDMAGEVFNIGGETTMTIQEMLDLMVALTSCRVEIEIEHNRLRPVDVTLQIPDCSKFKEATGWKPTISLDATLRDLLDYWRVD